MKKIKSINIVEYVDYRLFLRDYYAFQKKNNRRFSYRSFAKEADVSSSLFKDIVNERQNLSLAIMEKYAQAMQMSDKERDYFAALVQFNNSTGNTEKNLHLGEMIRLRGRSPVKFLDIDQYEYFSTWYHPVVREMVAARGLGDNPVAIAKAIVPNISPVKVRKSIILLKNLGLLCQGTDGTWHATDKIISSEYQIRSLSLKNYHREMLERARESIEVFSSENRELQGLTLSGSNLLYRRIKERIRTFTDELLTMVASDNNPAERVFQVNMQLFPFTKEDSDDEKHTQA